jgi:hypothetical protein
MVITAAAEKTTAAFLMGFLPTYLLRLRGEYLLANDQT